MLPYPDAVWTSSERAAEMLHLVSTAMDAPVGLTPNEVIWRKNKARLYRYRRTTPATWKTPVFLCLPLINRAYILDLRPGNSFVEFLLEQGHEVFMLDWGVWGAEDRGLTIDDLVARYLPRAIRRAADVAGSPVTLVGYCIGGALAACFAALYPDAPVRNLALLTAPIDFREAGQFGVWTAKGVFPVDKIRDAFDVIPGSMLDHAAKMLNPVGTGLGTYVQLHDKLGNKEFDTVGWQALYRWVNEGVPFPAAAYHQWITEFYQDNKLANGALKLDGRPVRLQAIRIPVLNVAASADTIAPRPTTEAILRLVSSADREEILLKGGHVGAVAGRSAKHDLWPKVADWLGRHDR